MFSHVTVGTKDLAAAAAFYDRVLAPLGLSRGGYDEAQGWAYWGREGEGTEFFVTRPFDGQAASVGNGAMVAFRAATPEMVDAAYAAGIAAGGTDEGPPGPRPQYSPGYYGAYLRDLDGNKLCFCRRGGV